MEQHTIRYAAGDTLSGTAFAYLAMLLADGLFTVMGAFGASISSIFLIMVFFGLGGAVVILDSYFREMDLRCPKPFAPTPKPELRQVSATRSIALSQVPEDFINQVFDGWEQEGKLPPTRALSDWDLPTVNTYYKQLVEIGCIQDRQERGDAGKIAPGWTRWRAIGILS